jgi:3-dehydroquinate dehydratase type I
MSLIAASIFVRDAAEVDDAIRRARTASSDGAGLIEWRVDVLADTEAGRTAIAALVAESPAPCIVTCRTVTEGGSFTGDLVAYAEALEAITSGDAQPRYLDVELAAWRGDERVRRLVGEVAARDRGEPGGATGVILSSHAVEGRPPDLLPSPRSPGRRVRYVTTSRLLTCCASDRNRRSRCVWGRSVS